jgi:general secretion pathway protein L
MSGGRYLLLFLDDARPGWLRLEDGVVAQRGDAGSPPPLRGEAPDRDRVVAVVPAEDVAVHWVELPALAPAQAAAAARLLAAEASAEPLERLHVAIDRGRGGDGEPRAMAIASAARMTDWLNQAAALGHDPDHLVPESLLIDPPETGLRRMPRGAVDIVRGQTIAFAAEPEVAAAAADGEAVETIDPAAFEATLAAVLANNPLDLRQGAFAKRRRWRVDWRLVRRLALLGAGILAVTLLIQLALILRYSFAADRLEAQADVVARRALPRAATIANASVQLNERLSALRGGGAGFGPTAAAAFAAVRDTPNVDLGSLRFDRDGSLQIAVLAAGPGDIAAVQQRLTAAGFLVTTGAPRPAGGR